jgi:hypothetical protein
MAARPPIRIISRTQASPIPEAPPVTKATVSFKSMLAFSSLRLFKSPSLIHCGVNLGAIEGNDSHSLLFPESHLISQRLFNRFRSKNG